ncbi:hypothetical protein DMB42_33625 [Nonomuraea sp. WAC 01424]|nr:hypothetical protein DMB42_33625 [Nonomuraea sp. WAC 01424]
MDDRRHGRQGVRRQQCHQGHRVDRPDPHRTHLPALRFHQPPDAGGLRCRLRVRGAAHPRASPVGRRVVVRHRRTAPGRSAVDVLRLQLVGVLRLQRLGRGRDVQRHRRDVAGGRRRRDAEEEEFAGVRLHRLLAGAGRWAAARAHSRSGYAAAAAAYERAAALSPEVADRARRLTLAAEATEFSGCFDRARDLAEGAGNPDTELTSRLIWVRACSDYGEGLLTGAHAMLSAGVDHLRAVDPRSAAWLLLDAASMIWFDGDRDMAWRTAEQLDALQVPPGDEVVPVHQLSRWFIAMALGRPADGLPPLAEVVESARALAKADRRGLLLTGGLGLAEYDARTHMLASAATATIRAEGMVGLLPQALTFLSRVEYARGRHAEARGLASEAVAIAGDTSQPAWARQAAGLLDQYAAVRGEALDPATAHPGALALLDLGQGRSEQALLSLEALVYGRSRNRIEAMHHVPDLVEAALRSGRIARAAEPFARLEAWAAMLDQRWADALVARCRALLEGSDDPGAHFRAALAAHERPFDRARTELLYGEWLRRARHTGEAQEQLRAALEVFERLGAEPWAERARTELGATGWSAPRRTGADRFVRLTPQERQIVQLAATGLSNRDIAAHLFLSPRTVGQHLYKAFPKLGVTARGQLADLTLDE